MLFYALIFAAIQSVAYYRGRKSPLYGVLGVVIFDMIVSLFSVDIDAGLLIYLAIGICVALISIGLVVLILFVLPKANLRDGAKPTEFPYLIATFALIALGVMLMIGNAISKMETGESGGGGGIIVLIIFSAAYASFRLHKRNNFAKEILFDTRSPIILLRSFANEGKKDLPFGVWDSFKDVAGRTFEEHISKYFKDIGPFIAFGNPTDYLPTLGAQKIYSSDAEWQASVEELIKGSKAVIIMEGNSPGLAWELNVVRSNVQGNKIFIVTPPKKFRTPRWDGFRKNLLTAGFKYIPEDPDHGSVIQFDSNFDAFFILKGSSLIEKIGEAIKQNLK